MLIPSRVCLTSHAAGGGGLSGVTGSVTITSTLTIANGAGQTQTIYVYVPYSIGVSPQMSHVLLLTPIPDPDTLRL